MADTADPSDEQQPPNPDGDEDEDFYNVEEIRARRINPETGVLEYLIKWENYAETANTWEPSDNLNCPDALKRFEEREKEKEREKQKKRRNVNRASQSRASSAHQPITPKKVRKDPLIIEEDSDSTTTDANDGRDANDKQVEEPTLNHPRGFDRGLPIESILGACTDGDERLWFFLKWKGLNELELVEASEIESKAPQHLCTWYRQRLYHTVKLQDESK